MGWLWWPSDPQCDSVIVCSPSLAVGRHVRLASRSAECYDKQCPPAQRTRRPREEHERAGPQHALRPAVTSRPASRGGSCCSAHRMPRPHRRRGGGSARCPRAHTSRFLSRIKLFLDVLMKEVLHPESRSPDGVRFHCIDVYLDELSKVGGKEVSHVPSASAAGTGKGGGWDRASAALQTPRVLGAGARGWHCGTSHRRA